MNAADPLALLYSVLFGVGIGLLFTVFEAAAILFFPGRIARFLLDIAFCLLAALASFLLVLAIANGTMRFFQAGGELLGFLAVQCTVTWAVRRFLPRCAAFLTRHAKRVENFFAGKIRNFCKIFVRKGNLFRKKEKKSTKGT